MKKLIVLFIFPAVLFAQKAPKLIVGIVVDHMRYEMLDRYKTSFGPNGFNRLVTEGMRFDSCTYNYIPTYTAPGHATIFTGQNPSVHGILGNDMYLAAENRTMYCLEDNDVRPAGTWDKNNARSPKILRAPTLGDSLKTANPTSMVISISGKDRGAILPGGKLADAAYWMDENSFLSTSSYYMDSLPAWVDSFYYSGYGPGITIGGWELLGNKKSYAASLPDNSPFESTLFADPAVFPYDLTALREKKSFGAMKYTPFANYVLTEFALWALREEGLGNDKHTDLLTISYSATDYIGHEFGPQSVEIHDAYLQLDGDIARLIDSLDVLVGRKNYVLFLTSDHGAANTPVDTAFQYVDNQKLKDAINAFALKKWNMEVVADINNGQIWLYQQGMQANKLKPAEVIEEIKLFLLHQKEVALAEVYSRTDIQLCKAGTCLLFKNAFDANLSGDIFYTRPYGDIERSVNYGTTHGTGYLYDTHVPLLFFGGNVETGQSKKPVHVDEILELLTPYLQDK
jgi:predicted AlkP superfamily pyrophosphatase or phosphodiesterase